VEVGWGSRVQARSQHLGPFFPTRPPLRGVHPPHEGEGKRCELLWILMTAAAAPLQVARNALQRGLLGDAGPWGATLVRFLFGLPFSLAIFGAVALATPGAAPELSARYVVAVSLG